MKSLLALLFVLVFALQSCLADSASAVVIRGGRTVIVAPQRAAFVSPSIVFRQPVGFRSAQFVSPIVSPFVVRQPAIVVGAQPIFSQRFVLQQPFVVQPQVYGFQQFSTGVPVLGIQGGCGALFYGQ